MNPSRPTSHNTIPIAAKTPGVRSVPVRTRSSDDTTKIQAHKAHRGSTQVAPNTAVLEYAQPKKKVLQSETDRWQKLASKMRPFYLGLEEHFKSIFSVAIECECSSLKYSDSYETIALTIPKEVLALVKKREKAGEQPLFKFSAQQKMTAVEVLERLRVLFSWLADEKEDVTQDIFVKGSVDLPRLVRIQFFFKYFLRVLNHWNFAHPKVGGGIPLFLQRNFLQVLVDKGNSALLGVIVNEMEFLREYVLRVDPGASSLAKSDDDPSFPAVSQVNALVSPGRMSSASLSPTQSPSPLSEDPSPSSSNSVSPSVSPNTLSPVSIRHPGVSSVVESIPGSRPRFSTDLTRQNLLKEAYANPTTRKQFLEFAKQRYAEENVMFLFEVMKIRDTPPANRAVLFKALSTNFLESSSEYEVNLSGKAKSKLVKGLEEGKFDDLSFLDLAMKEVESQVSQNLYVPFLEQQQLQPSQTSSSLSDSQSSELTIAAKGVVRNSSPRRSSVASAFGSPLFTSPMGSGASSPIAGSPPVSPTMEDVIERRLALALFGSINATPTTGAAADRQPAMGRQRAVKRVTKILPNLRKELEAFCERSDCADLVALHFSVEEYQNADPSDHELLGGEIVANFFSPGTGLGVPALPAHLQTLVEKLQAKHDVDLSSLLTWINDQLETSLVEPFLLHCLNLAREQNLSREEEQSALEDLKSKAAPASSKDLDSLKKSVQSADVIGLLKPK